MAGADAKSKKAGKKRLSLELSSDAYEKLTELAEKTDRNMADVLRFGLALYDIAIDAQEKNQGIGVVQDKEVIKEILIPKL
jgi:predicted transcriptional regulator